MQFTALGGAIAYPLLTHNARMFDAADDAERDRWIDRIMEADDDFLARHPESTLFAYFAGQPKKPVLQRAELLREWEVAEERARAAGPGERRRVLRAHPLSIALVALEEQRALNAGTRERIAQLQSELDAMHARFLYSRARRVVDSKWVRAVRGNSTVPEMSKGSVPDRTDEKPTSEAEENEGERRATADGGEHAGLGALATALIALDAEEWEYSGLSEQVETLQTELTALESELLYSTLKRLADARATRRIRGESRRGRPRAQGTCRAAADPA